MRHRHGLRKLNRTSSHRLAMLRNMTNSLLTHEVIKTTLPKAKELRRVAEPMITLAQGADARQPPPGVRPAARPRRRQQAVQRARPALQGAPGRLPAHPQVRLPRRRQRADGAGRARRPPRAGRTRTRRRRPNSEYAHRSKGRAHCPAFFVLRTASVTLRTRVRVCCPPAAPIPAGGCDSRRRPRRQASSDAYKPRVANI